MKYSTNSAAVDVMLLVTSERVVSLFELMQEVLYVRNLCTTKKLGIMWARIYVFNNTKLNKLLLLRYFLNLQRYFSQLLQTSETNYTMPRCQ
jgi:hypothetical protein